MRHADSLHLEGLYEMNFEPTNLPPEDDFHEYKSGMTPLGVLKDKLSKAASAFWNSGGGIFVMGANLKGQLDEGLPLMIGRQPIRDWIDQTLVQVQPNGKYKVTLFDNNPAMASFRDGKCNSRDRV